MALISSHFWTQLIDKFKLEMDHIDMLLNVFEKATTFTFYKSLPLAMMTIMVVLAVVKKSKGRNSTLAVYKTHTHLMKVYKCYLLLNVDGMKKFPFNKKERSECSVDARENIFITGGNNARN